MATEVWFRNPSGYIRELVEENASRIAWDRGFTQKRHIDIVAHANMYFPDVIPYRLLHVGKQGSAEYRKGDKITKPCAVYPTWAFGEDMNILEELMNANVAEDSGACTNPAVPLDERPVLGQEHRVVVTDLPPANVGIGRKFLRQLMEMQEDYPDCILHVHGLYSYRIAFGSGFSAADMEVRLEAQKGNVCLPNGKSMKYEQTRKCPQWISLMGFDINTLDVPRSRCMYNIRSAIWAGKYFQENIKFSVEAGKSKKKIDTTSPVAVQMTSSKVQSVASAIAKPGDKITCDTCSMANSCKYYRFEAVCSIKDSEMAPLARNFKTRSSDVIIDGLGSVLQIQAERLERGMENEEMDGELDPEVTRIINSLFTNGVKLAKLVDPALAAAGATKVGVFVANGNGAAAAVAAASPKQMVAAVVAELEAQGIARKDITPDMLSGVLAGPNREAIDAVAVERTA